MKKIPPKEAAVPSVEGTEAPVHPAIESSRKRPRKNQTNTIPRKKVAVSSGRETEASARTPQTGRPKDSASVASRGNDGSDKKRIRRIPDVDKDFLDFAKRRLNEIDVQLRGRNKLLFRNIAAVVAARTKRAYRRKYNGNDDSKNKFLQSYRKWIVKQLEKELHERKNADEH